MTARIVSATDAVNFDTLPPQSVVFSAGDAVVAKQEISDDEMQHYGVKPEGYLYETRSIAGVSVVAVRGLRGRYRVQPRLVDGSVPTNADDFPNNSNGLVYGIYDVLQTVMGVRWVHALKDPQVAMNIASVLTTGGGVRNNTWIERGPDFEFRAWCAGSCILFLLSLAVSRPSPRHYHTMHPLELVSYFNGFGPNLQQDEASWRSLENVYERFLEWHAVTRSNRFEFVLLEDKGFFFFCSCSPCALLFSHH